MNEASKEITKLLQAYVDEQQKHGHTPKIDELNQFMQKKMDEQNSSPKEKFQGFSPDQMFNMINTPFEEGCPVQLRQLDDEVIREIPFMAQALFLMRLLDEKDLKLTAQGYIPPKIVTDIYELGLRDWNTDYYRQKTEPRTEKVQVLRIALNLCGFIKIRKGVMSLTAKGRKIQGDANALLDALMHFMFWDFNVACFDIFEDEDAANVGRAYSLWLLHHYGEEWRDMDFYAEKYLEAFPGFSPSMSHAYSYRTFNRLFSYIGICEINDTDEYRGAGFGRRTRKREILDKMFSFTEPK